MNSRIHSVSLFCRLSIISISAFGRSIPVSSPECNNYRQPHFFTAHGVYCDGLLAPGGAGTCMAASGTVCSQIALAIKRNKTLTRDHTDHRISVEETIMNLPPEHSLQNHGATAPSVEFINAISEFFDTDP